MRPRPGSPMKVTGLTEVFKVQPFQQAAGGDLQYAVHPLFRPATSFNDALSQSRPECISGIYTVRIHPREVYAPMPLLGPIQWNLIKRESSSTNASFEKMRPQSQSQSQSHGAPQNSKTAGRAAMLNNLYLPIILPTTKSAFVDCSSDGKASAIRWVAGGSGRLC